MSPIYGIRTFSTLTLSEYLQLGRFVCVARIVRYGLLLGREHDRSVRCCAGLSGVTAGKHQR